MPKAVWTGAEPTAVDIPVLARIAVRGVAVTDGPASSAAAVDHCGVCTGLDGQVRHSFHPSRSAARGTTTDDLPDGVPLDDTHRPGPRLRGSPPPTPHRPA